MFDAVPTKDPRLRPEPSGTPEGARTEGLVPRGGLTVFEAVVCTSLEGGREAWAGQSNQG